MKYFQKHKFGFFRTSIGIPSVSIGDPKTNTERIIELILKTKNKEQRNGSSDLILFPELSITGYTCEDLFYQDFLHLEIKKSVSEILKVSKEVKTLIVIGLPFKQGSVIYNVAMVIKQGKILGIVPKQNLPNRNEFRETRWFDVLKTDEILKVEYLNQTVPFGNNLIFKDKESDAKIGIEICEDLFVMNSPSDLLIQNGCDIILNLSASNSLVGKKEFRKNLITTQSSKGYVGYVYASSTISESTTDLIFSGHSMIVEGGKVLKEMIYEENKIITSDIDIQSLRKKRQGTSIKFNDELANKIIEYSFRKNDSIYKILKDIDPYPFIPKSDEGYEEILKMQSLALANRFKKTKIPKALIGISGGLDSTWALLVTVEAFKSLNRPLKDIIGVTMPGFGTTNHTKNNAIEIMNLLGITSKKIDIREACKSHFKAINHSLEEYDLAFENVQARERTAVLMNLSNMENGLVIGTGNMSELALGWATYNGDHMSMYAVNGGLPKTLIQKLIHWYSKNKIKNEELLNILESIMETPISPELLPSDNDKISQKTESILGKYDIHDFILYHFLRNGCSPEKIENLLIQAFPNIEKEVGTYLKTFFNRFTKQQFKRSAMPDSVKIGSVSLSPRNDLRLPSDIERNVY